MEFFGKFFKVPKGHAHRHDAGTDTAIIRYTIADNGASCGIHDKPDISFDVSYFDIGFISSEGIAGRIVIVINKRLYAQRSSLTIVGDLLMGNLNVVEIFKSLGSLTKRKTKIYTECQA